jgi:hypothetical protein
MIRTDNGPCNKVLKIFTEISFVNLCISVPLLDLGHAPPPKHVAAVGRGYRRCLGRRPHPSVTLHDQARELNRAAPSWWEARAELHFAACRSIEPSQARPEGNELLVGSDRACTELARVQPWWQRTGFVLVSVKSRSTYKWDLERSFST